MAERSHWWTERWLELFFLEWLQWLQRSPHSQLLDVVCSCSCSCGCGSSCSCSGVDVVEVVEVVEVVML